MVSATTAFSSSGVAAEIMTESTLPSRVVPSTLRSAVLNGMKTASSWSRP